MSETRYHEAIAQLARSRSREAWAISNDYAGIARAELELQSVLRGEIALLRTTNEQLVTRPAGDPLAAIIEFPRACAVCGDPSGEMCCEFGACRT